MFGLANVLGHKKSLTLYYKSHKKFFTLYYKSHKKLLTVYYKSHKKSLTFHSKSHKKSLTFLEYCWRTCKGVKWNKEKGTPSGTISMPCQFANKLKKCRVKRYWSVVYFKIVFIEPGTRTKVTIPYKVYHYWKQTLFEFQKTIICIYQTKLGGNLW